MPEDNEKQATRLLRFAVEVRGMLIAAITIDQQFDSAPAILHFASWCTHRVPFVKPVPAVMHEVQRVFPHNL